MPGATGVSPHAFTRCAQRGICSTSLHYRLQHPNVIDVLKAYYPLRLALRGLLADNGLAIARYDPLQEKAVGITVLTADQLPNPWTPIVEVICD